MKKTPMKILHVGNHTTPCIGGIESVIWGAAKEQSDLGNDVHVLVFNSCTTGKESLSENEIIEGVAIHRIAQWRPFAFYRAPRVNEKMISLLKQMDIIHVHGFGGWMDALLFLRPFYKAKLIVQTHGGFFHTPHFAHIKKLYGFWLLFAGRFIDFLICDSQNDFDHFSHIAKNKTVLANGVSIQQLLSLPLSGKKMNHFIFVGRLSQNKQIDKLLDALVIAAKKNATIHLHVVGEDWDQLLESLKEKARTLKIQKNVTFHGKTSAEKLEKLYRDSGICVSASAYEGFGLTAIEGMAAGCIPILNDISSFRAFVGEKGRGHLVDYTNPPDAAKQWLECASQPIKKRTQLQQACREYARTYDWKHIAQEQLKIYSQTLNAQNTIHSSKGERG